MSEENKNLPVDEVAVEEKKTKAFLKNDYFLQYYEKEMQADAIKAEALAKLGRTE